MSVYIIHGQDGGHKYDKPLDHSINISLLKSIIDYDRYTKYNPLRLNMR